MKISRRARYAQMRRWKPSLLDIVRKTYREHHLSIAASMLSHNALLQRLRDA